MDAISDSGARAVFSRGNPGVVDYTITVVNGGGQSQRGTWYITDERLFCNTNIFYHTKSLVKDNLDHHAVLCG